MKLSARRKTESEKLERFKSNIFNRATDEIITTINEAKIYAFHSQQYGGIYKMNKIRLSCIDDQESLLKAISFTDDDKEYFGFFRLDSHVGYAQFMYLTPQELFHHHFRGNMKDRPIYVFDDTREFFEWCLCFDKLSRIKSTTEKNLIKTVNKLARFMTGETFYDQKKRN